jgi:EAL domain-containing protein (putative c-di-GMP-specific phosphodiesterase class I)
VGCNAYQGYLYSQPLCAEDATDMLRRQPLH